MNDPSLHPFHGAKFLDESKATPGSLDLSVFQPKPAKLGQGTVSDDYLKRCREEDPWPAETSTVPQSAAPASKASPAPPKTESVTTLVLSVFTDGTMNDAEIHVRSGTQSNVAKLFTLMFEGEDEGVRHEKKYVVGIGGGHRVDSSSSFPKRKLQEFGKSVQEGVEGFSGLGFAERVDEAMSWIGNVSREHPDAEIRIQLFGFSRGAAEAIHLVNVLNDAQELTRHGMGGRKVSIPFVGLFDPVSSLGVPGNDVNIGARLELRGDMAQRVVSLVAQVEVRALFDLLSIRIPPDDSRGPYSLSPTEWFKKRWSCPLPSSNWEEWVMPGVHSDVGGGYGPEEWVPDVCFQYEATAHPSRRTADAPGAAWVPLPDPGESLENYVYRMKNRELEYGAAPRGMAGNEFWSKEAVESRVKAIYEQKMERWRQKRLEEQSGNHSVDMQEFFREHPVLPSVRSRDNSLSRISLWVMIHRAEKAGVRWNPMSELDRVRREPLEPLSKAHPLGFLQELSSDPILIEQQLWITNLKFWQRIVPRIHDSRLAADLPQRVREVYFCGIK
ncbi:MAG TPA: DUF2235 domain-containing protein [Fibrobacteria bacterium]|nr:DUF2235 domain-containing protein [Fibrobacteria bacterium]